MTPHPPALPSSSLFPSKTKVFKRKDYTCYPHFFRTPQKIFCNQGHQKTFLLSQANGLLPLDLLFFTIVYSLILRNPLFTWVSMTTHPPDFHATSLDPPLQSNFQVFHPLSVCQSLVLSPFLYNPSWHIIHHCQGNSSFQSSLATSPRFLASLSTELLKLGKFVALIPSSPLFPHIQ